MNTIKHHIRMDVVLLAYILIKTSINRGNHEAFWSVTDDEAF